MIVSLLLLVGYIDCFHFPAHRNGGGNNLIINSVLRTGINEDGMVVLNVSLPFRPNRQERYLIDVSEWNSHDLCYDGFRSKGSCETTSNDNSDSVESSYRNSWSLLPRECSHVKEQTNQTVYPRLSPNSFWSGIECEIISKGYKNQYQVEHITYTSIHSPHTVDECTFRNSSTCSTNNNNNSPSPVFYQYSHRRNRDSYSRLMERRFNLYINKISPSNHLLLETKLDLHYDINPAQAISVGSNYIFCGPLFHTTATYGRIEDYFTSEDLFESILHEKFQKQPISEHKDLILSKYRISMLMFLQSVDKVDGSRTYRGTWYLLCPSLKITNIYQSLMKGTMTMTFSRGNDDHLSSFTIKSATMSIDDTEKMYQFNGNINPSPSNDESPKISITSASPMKMIYSNKVGPCEPLPKVIFEQQRYHPQSHGGISSTILDNCASYQIKMETKTEEYKTETTTVPIVYTSDEITGTVVSVSSGNDNVVAYLENVKILQRSNNQQQESAATETKKGNYSIWLEIRWNTRCYYGSGNKYEASQVCYISDIEWKTPKEASASFFDDISGDITIKTEEDSKIECRHPITAIPYFDINARSYYCIQRWKSSSTERFVTTDILSEGATLLASSTVNGVYRVKYITSDTRSHTGISTFSFFVRDATLSQTKNNNGSNPTPVDSNKTYATKNTTNPSSSPQQQQQQPEKQNIVEEENVDPNTSNTGSKKASIVPGGDDDSIDNNATKELGVLKYNGLPAIALILLSLTLIFGTVFFAVKRKYQHKRVNSFDFTN